MTGAWGDVREGRRITTGGGDGMSKRTVDASGWVRREGREQSKKVFRP